MNQQAEDLSADKKASPELAGPLRGALWMVLAGASFTSLTAVIREVSGTMHPFELAFFRNLFGLFFMLPWLIRGGFSVLQTQRMPLHAFRSLIGMGAMLCWFSAVAITPIAEATALSFTTPLFATVGAALFLGEVVRVRRWVATVVGLIGALIIVHPASIEIGAGAGLVLIASAFMAMAALSVKSLSRTETPSAIVLFMGLLMTPLSLIPALFHWTTPQLSDYPWFVALGLFATVGQIAMARAFASADISAVLPFDFSRLIFAAILGYLLFAESPDMWTWVGAAIIFSATLYTAHRESRQARLFRSVQANLVPAICEAEKKATD